MATKPVDILFAQAHFWHLVERAAAGEEILIAQGGRPVVRLISARPSPPKRPRRVGALKGKIWMSPDFDAPLPPAIGEAFGVSYSNAKKRSLRRLRDK